MFYDLNIPCPLTQQLDKKTMNKLKLILARYAHLGHYTVALNHTVELCDLSKIPSKKLDTAALSDPAVLNSRYPIQILQRITIKTNDSLEYVQFCKLRQIYDVVAVRTNSLHVFKQCCETYDIDLITLDCTERLTFELNPLDLAIAIKRQIYFELCYANAIRDQQQARMWTLQIGKQLVEYTNKGHCLIISSEAEAVSEVRSSGDVFYFAKSLGLPNDKAKFTTQKHPELLLDAVTIRKKKTLPQMKCE